MSGIVHGRAVGYVGAAAAAVMLLCRPGPALGESSVGVPGDVADLAARYEAIAPPPIAAPDRIGIPKATVSGACAYEHSSVSRTPVADLRAAVVCLINRARARWHLPPVHERAEIERAAQRQTGQMVAIHALTHYGGSSPGSRLSDAGYRWSAFGEMLAS